MHTVYRIRDLRTQEIGKLTTISSTVTRMSEVRPELLFAKYTCLDCGTQTENPIEQQYKFTEPTRCPKLCVSESNKMATGYGW